MKLLLRAALGVAVAVSLAACDSSGGGSGGGGTGGTGPGGGGGGTSKPGPQHTTGGESWTWLVYMVADNNLEPAALDDLNEMMAVGSTDKLHIVVQSDRADGYTNEGVGGLPDWLTTKRLYVREGVLEEVSDLGELNMGEPSVLADFIEWGVKSYPADRYALIFWDHGGAWPGFGGDDSTPNHDLLDLAELRSGIKDGMTRAGIDGFALIGFDACLMATHETALAMREFGEYQLSSEELEPGHGWDYRSLEILKADPKTQPPELARRIMDGFEAQAAQAGTGQELTLSLLDLTLLGELEAAVNTFAQAAAKTDGTLIGKQRAQTLGFGKAPDPTQDTHMMDLGQFVAELAQADSSLKGAADAVKAALDKVVIHNLTAPSTTAATGVAIYFPPQAGLYNQAYDNVSYVGPWRDFIKAYYAAGGQVTGGPDIGVPNNTATIAFQDGLYVLQAALPQGVADAIVDATTFLGVVDSDGSVIAVGDVPAAWDATAVTGFWDATVLTVSQGNNVAYGYMSIEEDSGYTSVSVPFAYVDLSGQAQYVVLRRVIDGSGAALSDVYYLYTDFGVAELIPQAGTQMFPLLLFIDTSGQSNWDITTETPFDPTQAIGLSVEPLQAGTTLYIEVDIYDFAGNSDYVFGTAVVGGGGPGPDPGGCGNVDQVGTCDGTTLLYCSDQGQLVSQDCAANGCACGFDEANGYYDCLCGF